jgi:glycosyltransferase involved in cell wall biosynthesis
MRVLAFGTYDVRAHPRVAVLIEGLRTTGHEVVELNEPLRLDTAARVAILRQPWRLGILLAELARCWVVLARRAVAARRARPEVVLVGYLGHFDVHLARLLFPRSTLVLDHLVSAAGTARDRGLTGRRGPKARLLEAIDAAALRRADVVVVDTPEHLDALPRQARPRAVVCPVGAAEEWFAEGAAAAGRPVGTPLRAVFVGVYTPLHGTPVLAEALAELAHDRSVEVTMVGRGQDHARARQIAAANPRVRWVDWVPGEDLAGFVAAHDVSLGIFGTTPKALDVVPTKVFQGAAAGCAIVTSDTPPQRAALGDAAVLVPPGDARALAEALRRLAAEPDRTARLRACARDRAGTRFTARAVVDPMVARMTAPSKEPG